jgi:spermine oxidase
MAVPHNLFGTSKITDNRMTFVQSDGSQLKTNAGQRLHQLAESILEDEEELKRYQGSLGDYFVQKFTVCLKRDEYSDIDEVTAQQFLEFYEKYQNLSNASSTWFDLSAEGFTHYEWCDGDLYLNWKDRGFRTLFDLLTRSIPDPKLAIPIDKLIYFNKTVVNIDWSEAPPVRVTCSDETKIDADHVIVTTSLGVLKERLLTMFTPELPIAKSNAIRGLSMGTVDKIYLQFKKTFWDEDFHGFSLLWRPEDRAEMLKNPQVSWLLDVLGFYPVDYQPNVLCGWISGKTAIEVEQLSDQAVQEGLLSVLRKFLPTYNVPVPIAMARSKWNSNPNFRGSYSYRSLSTDLLHTSAADLSQPLLNARGEPVLQFAGEATHERFYSTVHGAVETGWREAERLVKTITPQEPQNFIHPLDLFFAS